MVIVLLHVIMSVHDPMMWMIVEFLGRGQSVCDYDRDNVTFGLPKMVFGTIRIHVSCDHLAR